ncbi:MAG: hypothetical protein A2Y10_07925 [Planctomycetes bacterium GWF2_41_51]|nr:MAG: hypothetical protein A2Y10_07925 [Planctomycetes bacterium GWF2_41_51]HBG26388.1 transcriptional repressor [Phycisphaerales bacterium]
MADIQELINDFRAKCKKQNLSMTPQRIAIYEELIKAKDHPGCDEIYERVKKNFPDISLDTVYRTLSTFAQIGVIHLVEGYGEAKRYDPDINQHHHLRCLKCNKIVDFQDETFNNLRVPKTMEKSFTIKNVKVILEGLCSACIKKQ